MTTYTYQPQGVCSQLMEIAVEDGKLLSLNVIGGCSGNLQGIARLVQGMPVDEVIAKFDGIRCGSMETSCPDQLAKGLRRMKEELEEEGTDA